MKNRLPAAVLYMAAGVMAQSVLAAEIIVDEVIIQGNSVVLTFDDNSVAAGVPNNDWQIVTNDNFNGGDSFLAIRDDTAGTTPFKIFAEAPSTSLLIAASGDVGIGTFEPTQALDITRNNTPTIRLQETAEGPFQIWDIGGNDANFFIREASAGNTLPFRIQPGAPTSSIDIAPSGQVGFGTDDPLASIHVVKASQAATAEVMARFDISDDIIGKLEIRNGSTTDGIFHPRLRGTAGSQAVPLTVEGLITTDVGANPVVAYDAAKRSGGAVVTRPLVVYRNNGVSRVTIAANGVVTATSFNPVSSRALKHDIEALDSQEATEALRHLAPVKFIYNDDESNQQRVGFIAEDVPEVVAAPDRQSVPVMDVVALVTRVVKDQQQTIDEQGKALDQQTKALEEQTKFIAEQRNLNELLMKRLAELESQVATKK